MPQRKLFRSVTEAFRPQKASVHLASIPGTTDFLSKLPLELLENIVQYLLPSPGPLAIREREPSYAFALTLLSTSKQISNATKMALFKSTCRPLLVEVGAGSVRVGGRPYVSNVEYENLGKKGDISELNGTSFAEFEHIRVELQLNDTTSGGISSDDAVFWLLESCRRVLYALAE